VSDIFIIGNGRSGTNWLSRLLAGAEGTELYREDPRFFPLAVDIAVRRQQHKLPELLKRYDKHLSTTKVNIEKSHPVLWFAEKVAEARPRARFISIQRDPVQCVASTMQHGGTRGWLERWEELPRPNPFLGLGEENVEWYRELSVLERAAVRWASHARRLRWLKKALGPRLLCVDFTQLVERQHVEVRRLSRYIGLPLYIKQPADRGVLYKWARTLTPGDVERVLALTKGTM
jgi:hypothetical protein